MRSICLLIVLSLPVFGQAISVYVDGWNTICGQNNGAANASVGGGIPPFDYVWSNGSQTLGSFEYTNTVTGLAPGSYTVLVTDAGGSEASAQFTITADNQSYYLAQLSGAGLHGCNNECNIGRWIHADLLHPGLVLPLSFDPPLQQVPDVYIEGMLGAYYGFCPWEAGFGFSVTDAMGCIVNYEVQLEYGTSAPSPMEVVSVNGACDGGNGSVTLDVGLSMNDPVAIIWDYRILNANYTVAIPFLYAEPVPGQNIVTVNNLAAGDYILERRFTNHLQPCVETMLFTIPSLGAACGTISGMVWLDVDQDCIKDQWEPHAAGVVLEILPGPYYVLTNGGGAYAFDLPMGSYQISLVDDDLDPICPAGGSIPFTVNNNITMANFALVAEDALDLKAYIGAGAARPGFDHSMYIYVNNLKPQFSGPISITLEYDPLLTFLGAAPAPSTISGNTLTWELPALAPFGGSSIALQFNVPISTPLGTVLTSQVSVSNTLPEVNYLNNTASVTRTVTGSYDPNDKLVATSTGASGSNFYIGEDEWLDYTIRFQNTGTDTAFTVVITDTLAMELDMATFQQGVASHPFQVSFKPDRVIEWRFESILLPDSNVNEPGSHGLMNFRIKPVSSITPGTAIINIANIYFDFNPPVITEPSVLVASVPPIKVAVKAMLGGPFVTSLNTMSDALRVSGALPLTEPYTGLGYMHAGSGGGESTTAGVLGVTGNYAIVDWVVVELREPSTFQVIHTRSALIRRDGQVVDMDGVSPVAFNAFEGSYRIAIRHRNHLGCMTASPVALSFTSTVVDLTLNSTATYGTSARQNINGTMVLWPGDVNFDGVVKYTGSGNDRDPVLVAIGGTVPTNVVSGGYSGEDVDMNGSTKYTGASNDRDIILQTIGGTVPTAVRVEQVP